MTLEGALFTWHGCLEQLRRRLEEPRPSRIQLLTGPRQVGKTTLLLALAREWGPSALYAAADGPEASLPGFWERTWLELEEKARSSGRALLLLDEAHHIPAWAARLKGEWDRHRRLGTPIHVVASGSSALRLASGSKESLAGRFERLTLAHWPAAALAEEFGLEPEAAASLVVSHGSYPGAMDLLDDTARWTAYVRDAILEPAVGRDLLALGQVRRPALLRQVMALAASMPAQVVSLQKLQGRLAEAGALETIARYLELLEEAYLVAALPKHARRPARGRAAPPKLIVLSNALLAAADPRGIPDRAADPSRHGAWVGNACLAHAWNAGQQVCYWREAPLEVDAVIDGSWGSWALEVKTGAVELADLAGLLEFARRNPRYRPLLLADGLAAARKAGIACLSWQEFLVHGVEGI